jgi:hypothetical protein
MQLWAHPYLHKFNQARRLLYRDEASPLKVCFMSEQFSVSSALSVVQSPFSGLSSWSDQIHHNCSPG